MGDIAAIAAIGIIACMGLIGGGLWLRHRQIRRRPELTNEAVLAIEAELREAGPNTVVEVPPAYIDHIRASNRQGVH